MTNNLAKILAFIMAYFAPVSTIIHVMLIFILIDLISGIWADIKQKQLLIIKKEQFNPVVRLYLHIVFIFECIESYKLRRTITKAIWYTVAVLMAHMMEKTFSLQFMHLVNFIGCFICLIEVKSVFENITKITNEPIFMKIYKIFAKKADIKL